MADFNLLKRFRNETEGNVSIMFAMSFTATFLMIGAAFDLVLLNKSEENIQYLADAAALSALQFDGDVKAKEDAFVRQMDTLARISGHTAGVETTNVIVNQNESAFTLSATVNVPHDLIMLQNIDGFESVSVSTQAVMGTEDIEIALALDISASMRGSKIIEAQESSKLFINDLLRDENLDGRVSVSLIPFGGTVRVPADLINLLDVPSEGLESYADKWIDGEWNQCFEFDASDIEDGMDPNGLYRAIPDFVAYRYRYPWCPIEGNEMVPLTNDANFLEDKIDSFTLSDGTGSDHGMAWAYATLNNKWKNKFPGGLKDTPARNNAGTRKIIVFMTDGGITEQRFVKDKDLTGKPPFDGDGRNRVPLADARAALFSICDEAKENEIEIYTIGYDLKNNTQRTQLEYCATSTSHNYSSDSGELENVFSGLAASISPLRTSR